MPYYNGSGKGDIKEFKVSLSRDGYVYATDSRLVALTYIARVYPNMFVTRNGKECFLEIVPDFFEKTVKGRSGYLYTLENAQGFESVPQSNKCGHTHVVRISKDVKVTKVEFISDIYSELLKYIHSGELIIQKFDTLDKDFVDKFQAEIIKNSDQSKTPINRVDLILDYKNRQEKDI